MTATGPNPPFKTPPWQLWGIRACALLIMIGLAGASSLAITVRDGPVTPLRGLVAGITAVFALGCLGLTFAPDRVIDTIIRRLVQGLNQVEQTRPFDCTRAGNVLLAFGFLSSGILLQVYLSTPNVGAVGDQGAYLETAQWINANGGLSKLPENMLNGTYPEANRHPLFIALLSVSPEFTAGRWLSAGFGLCMLVLLAVFLTQRYGYFTAGIATVLLGTNKLFLLSSSRMVCEGLLGLLCLYTWWSTVAPPKSIGEGLESSKQAGYPLAAELGLMAGLIWLTKGTGLLIAFALGLWWVFKCLPNWKKAVTGGLVLTLVFLATGSLLIARNLERFGEPFYNLNSLLLFADTYDELDGMLEEGIRPRDAAREFLATHTAVDLVKRAVSGLIWETFILIRSFGPAPLGDARVLFGGPLCLAFLVGLAGRREFRQSVFPLWLLVLIPMFGWYVPIAAGDRFLVPLLCGMVTVPAVVISQIPAMGGTSKTRLLLERVIVYGLGVWCLVTIVLTLSYGPNEFAPG